jgi:hypothetical protein
LFIHKEKTVSEIYLSSDIEADGKIPGPHSMLSFATIAFSDRGERLSNFSANLELLPGAVSDPSTMEWWKTQPEAWAETRKDLKSPGVAMSHYLSWLKGLGENLVFVAYPATYDFMFIYWYLIKFTGECPFGYAGLDMKSFAMAQLKIEYTQVSRRTLPQAW